MKRWQLQIITRDAPDSSVQVVVDAKNWMLALQSGRAQLGDPGGVPPGADCVVAPDGSVVVNDVSRSFHVLPVAMPVAPEVPAAPEQAAPSKKRVARQTMAFQAGDLEQFNLNMPPKPKKKPRKTMALIPGQSFELPPRPTPTPTPSEPIHVNAATEQTDQSPKVRLPPSPVRPISPAKTSASTDSLTNWSAQPKVLHQRDSDPSEELPICYRERSYRIPKGASNQDVDNMLQAQFKVVQEEIKAQTAGKFIHLLAFDHHWSDKPLRPACAALQWKNWQGGQPTVTYAERSSLPPTR